MQTSQSLNSPGVRLIQLYMLLATSNREYSLKRLTEFFRCSPQTVLRMLDQLKLLQGFELECRRRGREHLYRAKQPARTQPLSLNVGGLRHLMLCRDIVRHVLPKPLQDEIRDTIGAASLSLGEQAPEASELNSYAESFGKGLIDYTPFQDYLDTIQEAMHAKRLCKLRYSSKGGTEPKSYLIAPVSLLAFREALYLRCAVCDESGAPREDDCRTFAIHRIRTLKPLNQRLESLPQLEESNAFGFPFHEPIRVRVAFSPTVADYVRERQWSKDQRIRNRKGGGILLTFTSTSRKEVLSWVLSFGQEAELLEPKDLRQELANAVTEMAGIYG